ncbi:MAG: PIN domain-containing protein [Chitinivibrionales bacterium]|nr:PIN domain-containing protein [Chitinivibrionales bacterium]
MNYVAVDTSSIIAVVLNEPEKSKLIEITSEAELIAPPSVHWKMGNAFSAMFKKKRLKLREAIAAIKEYRKIPIQFVNVELESSIRMAEKENIYAYDAYILVCAKKYNAPLLSLDEAQRVKAVKNGIKVLEV